MTEIKKFVLVSYALDPHKIYPKLAVNDKTSKVVEVKLVDDGNLFGTRAHMLRKQGVKGVIVMSVGTLSAIVKEAQHQAHMQLIEED
ncbi:hypothetical protein SAMN05421749_1034 [Acinetobacter marinus]|uniref:Uncharacterized protein n=1 Tax=Acinetobacter marinus TaxID=281375 RepID=A0A1G6IDF0_9GAMM|nr:hypothetical protein [Acinetobacter marinus]SDC04572.1 hypothetical protein SAMN05421749_1034 [Acinetobacter marinus]